MNFVCIQGGQDKWRVLRVSAKAVTISLGDVVLTLEHRFITEAPEKPLIPKDATQEERIKAIKQRLQNEMIQHTYCRKRYARLETDFRDLQERARDMAKRLKRLDPTC